MVLKKEPPLAAPDLDECNKMTHPLCPPPAASLEGVEGTYARRVYRIYSISHKKRCYRSVYKKSICLSLCHVLNS